MTDKAWKPPPYPATPTEREALAKRKAALGMALAPHLPQVLDETVLARAKAMYAQHPTYRGTKPLTWYEAPQAARREWLDKAEGEQQ